MSPSTDYSMAVPANVLIVDDMPINLQLLAAYLKAAGHNVRAVPRGDLALNAVASAKPDIILLDVMMPRMSGYEVAEHLQADPDTVDIPIVFISGLSDEGFKKQAFHRGAVDYIVKPFKRDDVLSAVKKHVEASRHSQQAGQQPDQQASQQPLPVESTSQELDTSVSSSNYVATTTTSRASASAGAIATEPSTSSSQDTRTRLYTHDQFDTLLKQAWQHSLAQTTPLGLMLIALDDQLNDSPDVNSTASNHSNLLHHVARLMQANLASDAQISHYKGRSFGVILTNTPLATALAAAERLRSSISAYDWGQHSIGHLTVSIGVASSETLTSHVTRSDNIHQLDGTHQHILQAAQAQLQRAQTQGGNEVCAPKI
ncbi:MAG: response regulator [Deinococcota bacterium]